MGAERWTGRTRAIGRRFDFFVEPSLGGWEDGRVSLLFWCRLAKSCDLLLAVVVVVVVESDDFFLVSEGVLPCWIQGATLGSSRLLRSQ